MALTGLDIYKLLPKTNCKKCGFPTCLAFAMALAQKKTSLARCPDVTEEAKMALESASEPPIRTITLGTDTDKIELGGETVLFRHEKTFLHPCGLGVLFSDNLPENVIKERIEKFNLLTFDRVGKKVGAEFILLKNDSNDKNIFLNIFNIIKAHTKAFVILQSNNITAFDEVLKVANDRKQVIYPVTDNIENVLNLAKIYNVPVVVHSSTLDEIVQIVQKYISAGVKDLFLDLSDSNPKACLEKLIQVRRVSLKKTFRLLGYPTIVCISQSSGETDYEVLSWAITYILKYASIVILPEPISWQQLALVTARLNIYTDPQKPVTVEPGIYSIGGQANDKSPLLVTTNFSLTYFTVEPEIVNSKIPSWLLVVDSEGLSVLTAWAAEKFTPEKINDAIKKFNIDNLVTHKKIIIPGYVAVMSGKLNELSGREVLVGPCEASGIPKFLRTIWQT